MSEQQPPWNPPPQPSDGRPPMPPQGPPSYGQQSPYGGPAAPPYAAPPYGGPSAQRPPYQQPSYGQQQYPPYPPPYYAPVRQPRPPLTGRAKRGAMIAGGLGFSLMTLGFYLFVAPLFVAAIGGFANWIVNIVISTGDPEDVAGATRIAEAIGTAWQTAWWILVVVMVVGLVVWLAGYFSSVGIMRGHGVTRPTAVTWAGLGIAIVGSWVISWFSSFFSPLLFTGLDYRDGPVPDGFWLPVLAWGVIGIIVNIAIGLLAWWWMAWAMRPRPEIAAPGACNPYPGQGQGTYPGQGAAPGYGGPHHPGV